MKKVLLVTITLIITSCASPTGSNAAVDGVGFFKPMPDEKLITGSDDLTDLWMKYLDEHNTQDIAAIKSMSADSVYILSPDGSDIFPNEQPEAVVEP